MLVGTLKLNKQQYFREKINLQLLNHPGVGKWQDPTQEGFEYRAFKEHPTTVSKDLIY